MIQLRILSQVPNTKLWRGKWIGGRLLGATRGVVNADGVEAPFGGTGFEVPHGAAKVGDVVRSVGQFFRVEGVAPLGPFFVKDRLTTTQTKGSFTEAPLQLIVADGEYMVVDGDRVGVY